MLQILEMFILKNINKIISDATYVANYGDYMNYKNISEIINKTLNLKNEAVGVKLFKKESDAEKYFEKSDRIIHCQAIITASKGNSFYATANELGCPIACQILGLKEMKENILNGKYFNKNNITKTQNDGENLIKSVPKLNEKIEAVGYAPLSDLKFTPDVIAVIAKPKQVYQIIKAYVYETGKRLESSVSGTQSLCGDIVAKTYLENSFNISYGCVGSHLATEFGECDVAVGIPADKLESIVKALEITKLPK